VIGTLVVVAGFVAPLMLLMVLRVGVVAACHRNTPRSAV